jgi:hypothetical protein
MHKTKISLLAHLLCEKRDISGSPEGIRTLVAGLRSQSPRPLDDGALVHVFSLLLYCAGVPGLEPRLTEPESAGLPITPYPKVCTLQWQRIPADLECQSRVNTQQTGLFT